MPILDPSVEDPQPLTDGFFHQFVDKFNGVNTNKRTDLFDTHELITGENVRNKDGLLEIDTGIAALGQTLVGTPRKIFYSNPGGGTKQAFLLTNSTIYVWVAGETEWQYVSNGTSTTTIATSAAGATTITVSSITGFADGERIGIILDDGTQHQTTIDGSPSGSTITFDDAIPAGLSVEIGADVVEAVSLNGSNAIPVDGTDWDQAGAQWFIFTNGVDTPLKHDGTDIQAMTGFPGSTFAARYVEQFKDYLIFGYTTENGTAYVRRYRWCDTGDATDWTTGNASYTDASDHDDDITGMDVLGIYLIIYKDRTIVRLAHLGQAGKIFDPQTTVDEQGAVSNDAIVDVGDRHIVVGRSMIYEYTGDFFIRRLDDKLFRGLFSTDGELDPNARQNTWAAYIKQFNEIFVFYPTSGNTYPAKMVRINLETKQAFFRTFAKNFIGHGLFPATAARRWSDLVGAWNVQNLPWNAHVHSENTQRLQLCATDLKVYEYDFATAQDIGVDISYSLVTKDFISPGQQIRLDRVESYMKGSSITIAYSTDEGASYTTIASVSPGNSAFALVREGIQILADTLRFKISGSGAPFAMRWFNFRYKDETVT